VTDEKTLMDMIDYIYHNPVRPGLIERAEEWKCSSAAWYLGIGTPPLISGRIPPE
jgi:hypothetical protein